MGFRVFLGFLGYLSGSLRGSWEGFLERGGGVQEADYKASERDLLVGSVKGLGFGV